MSIIIMTSPYNFCIWRSFYLIYTFRGICLGRLKWITRYTVYSKFCYSPNNQKVFPRQTRRQSWHLGITTGAFADKDQSMSAHLFPSLLFKSDRTVTENAPEISRRGNVLSSRALSARGRDKRRLRRIVYLGRLRVSLARNFSRGGGRERKYSAE